MFMRQDVEVWYRYIDRRFAAPLDEYDMPIGPGRADVVLLEYEVLKHTPKGVWLRHYNGFSDKRFVNRHSKKRFACPTKEEALDSFIARKQRERRIYSARIRHIDEVLAIIASTTDLEKLGQ